MGSTWQQDGESSRAGGYPCMSNGPSYPLSNGSSHHHNQQQQQQQQHQSFFMEGTNDPPSEHPPMTGDPHFDILDWHPAYQSCQRYFLDHAQHEPATQALCALINIRLPFQWHPHPVTNSGSQRETPNANGPIFNFGRPHQNNHIASPNRNRTAPTFVSLVPYVRRLIVTAFDKPPILHGLFGDDYVRGILPHVDCERRNYLFAAKHGGWRSCKKQYDSGSGGGGGMDETCPFMKPLDAAKMEELTAAEKAWSSWLAMEDWMVGPRAPGEEGMDGLGSSQQERRGERVGHPWPDGLPDQAAEGAFRNHRSWQVNASENTE